MSIVSLQTPIREGLKILFPQGSTGSSPVSGTIGSRAGSRVAFTASSLRPVFHYWIVPQSRGFSVVVVEKDPLAVNQIIPALPRTLRAGERNGLDISAGSPSRDGEVGQGRCFNEIIEA